MASKNNSLPDKPIVSRVPLPISDSALVIDLPDGQKLVIGKMGQGTVIEVATWRGVGRPDSRTNRMMFGMSSAEIEEEAGPLQEESNLASTAGFALRIVGYPLALLKWLFNIQSKPKVKKRKDGRKKLIIDAKAPSAEGAVSTELVPVEATASGSTVASVKKSPLMIKSLLLHTLSALSKSLRNFDLERGIATIKAAKSKLVKGARSIKKEKSSKPTSDFGDSIDIDKWLDSITTKASGSVKTSSFGQGHVAIKSGTTPPKKAAKKVAKK
jgi:hypothetical protein